jgi:hypothetical protein
MSEAKARFSIEDVYAIVMSYDARAKAEWLESAAAVLKSDEAFPAFIEASAALEAHIIASVGVTPEEWTTEERLHFREGTGLVLDAYAIAAIQEEFPLLTVDQAVAIADRRRGERFGFIQPLRR